MPHLTIKLTQAEAKAVLIAVTALKTSRFGARMDHKHGSLAITLDNIDRKIWDAADAAGLTEEG